MNVVSVRESRRPGFTPIEVLMVIAIIGILAAMPLTAVPGVTAPNHAAAQAAEPAELTVFAAASMTEVVTALARDFARSGKTNTKLSFASNATLAKQIESGAGADVFIAVDPVWVEYLEKKGLLVKGSRTDFAGNLLVLIAPAGRGFAFTPAPGADLASAFAGRLAVGDPESVPAGKYAREALEWMKCWDTLKSRLAPAPDVRSALRLVATGETDAGIVYRTDAAVEPRVTVVAAFPEQSHRPIVYTAALCAGAKGQAREFIALLGGPEGRALLAQHGFLLPGEKE